MSTFNDLPQVARRFECFFNFLGWWQWSIGVHVDVRHPHFDLHVPFGFLRIGWHRCPTITKARHFGYDGWRREAELYRNIFVASSQWKPLMTDSAREELDITMIKARADAATKGPWRLAMSGYSVKSTDDDMTVVAAIPGGAFTRFYHGDGKKGRQWIDNADFIAAARGDIPALISEIERLRTSRYKESSASSQRGPHERKT